MFPQGCHVCLAAVRCRETGVACDACWEDPGVTPLYRNCALCERCGLPGTGRCLTCAPDSIAAVRSVGEYAGALRATLLDIKRRPRAPLLLGEMLAEVWRASEALQSIDAVVPVPLHPERLAERGHNQAEVIARALASRIGLPVEIRAVARVRAAARRRIGAGREARSTESEGAFSAASRLVSGKRLLLVDDVFTTGATLGACADALRAAGAQDVVAITAARVRMGSTR